MHISGSRVASACHACLKVTSTFFFHAGQGLPSFFLNSTILMQCPTPCRGDQVFQPLTTLIERHVPQTHWLIFLSSYDLIFNSSQKAHLILFLSVSVFVCRPGRCWGSQSAGDGTHHSCGHRHRPNLPHFYLLRPGSQLAPVCRMIPKFCPSESQQGCSQAEHQILFGDCHCDLMVC